MSWRVKKMELTLGMETFKFKNVLPTIYGREFSYRCHDVGRLRTLRLYGRVRTDNGDIAVLDEYTGIVRLLRVEKMVNASCVEMREFLVGTKQADSLKAHKLLSQNFCDISEIDSLFESNKRLDPVSGKIVPDPIPNPDDFDSLARGKLCSKAAKFHGSIRRQALQLSSIQEILYNWRDETAK